MDLSKRYGGASTRAITVAKVLREWDAGIAVLEGSPVWMAAKGEGIPVFPVGKSRLDPRIPQRIATVVRRGGFQLIDTQNIQSKVWGSMAARLSGCALVSTLNSIYPDEHGGSLKGRLYTLLDRMTNRDVARYIAVSQTIKGWLCQSGIEESRIDLIHNGIDISDEETSAGRRGVRQQLGLPEEAILCTAVGRLVWAKGYEDLVKAFALVAQTIPNAFCVIVGDGELRSALENQIAEAGLSQRILLIGYREHSIALDILRSSDIFAMPSRTEGIPYALLEAGAVGLPIVATRSGGIPEVVRDRTEAQLIDAGDFAGLASALQHLYADPSLRQRLSIQVKRRIRDDFSLEAQAAATKASYVRAVQSQSQAPGR